MLKRILTTLIALSTITAVAALGYTTAEAGGLVDTFDVPDLHYGDTITIPVDTSDRRSVLIRCDSPQGFYQTTFPVTNKTATIGPFTSPPWPAGDAQCVADVGSVNGSGVWHSVLERGKGQDIYTDPDVDTFTLT